MMKKSLGFKAAGAFFAAASLGACGGGGGGSPSTVPTLPTATVAPSAPVVTVDQSWLKLSPASVDLITFQGEATSFKITASAQQNFAGPINVAIVDSVGVLAAAAKVQQVSNTSYTATMITSAALSIGTHASNLELRLCEDSPLKCAKPVSGSPWYVPLRVTVRSPGNLTPLPVIASIPTWSTYQGNAAHNAYVPASFDVSRFSRRWVLPHNAGATAAVHENGRVFTTVYDLIENGMRTSRQYLIAHSEETGKELWRTYLGSYSFQTTSPPAAADGKIYFSTKDDEPNFWVVEQTTGAVLSKKKFYSQRQANMAPTVLGGNVFTPTGYYRGMSMYSTVTNKLIWEMTQYPLDAVTPSVDATHLYAVNDGTLFAMSVSDGKPAYDINAGAPASGTASFTVPVLSGKQTAFAVSGSAVVCYDLATRSVKWKSGQNVNSTPVVAKDVVYVLGAKGTVLEAYAAADGALLWTSAPLAGNTIFRSIILTDNVAFVSAGESTVALDLASRKVVWTYPVGGSMSISNRGVLYIAGAGVNNFAVVNLQ